MYIGDEEFFLFDSGFSISKHIDKSNLDVNFLKLTSKEFSILSKIFQNSGESAQKCPFLASRRASFWKISELDPA
jgi:hypothetical protein